MSKILHSRIVMTFAAIFLVANLVGGCHAIGHAPPGQVKKVVNPPPALGGVPPGQLKKY